MRYEWDPVKGEANLRKHGMNFRDVATLFEDHVLIIPDTSEDHERRWLAFRPPGIGD